MNSKRFDRVSFAGHTVMAASAIILCLGLSGCTANKVESSPKARKEQVPSPATLAWKSKEVLASDVEVRGDVAIAYRRLGPQMEIIARDLKNGKQLWKDEALGAADRRSIAPEINTVEYDVKNYVAYMGTKTGTYSQLKIAEVSTGKLFKVKKNFEFWGDRPFV